MRYLFLVSMAVKMLMIHELQSVCEEIRMLKFSCFVTIALCLCGSALGQEVPRVEVFGGYSYLNFDTNDLTSRQSANGWESAVSGNFNKWFAAEGDFSRYYKTYSLDLTALDLGSVSVNVNDFSFLAGPRVNVRPAFFHALFGVDHLKGSALGYSASQDSFAAAFGGGIQWNVAPQWAVRASGDYVLTHHNIFGPIGSSFTQNNIRATVGIAYVFGATREGSPRAERAPRAERKTVASQPCAGSSEAALLGVVGCSANAGFRVTSVHWPAAQIGIVPGDIVTSIDGRPVHDSHEIETAIAANTSGTAKVGYMIQGNYLTEREVKVR
jgi:opacity protein-like surface antigen